MLKYLDILIGLSAVMLLGSMLVSFIMQWISDLLNRRAARLLAGLASLLQQCDSRLTPQVAQEVTRAVLAHPLVRGWGRRLGSVVPREELVRLLLELASPDSPGLGAESKRVLREVLAEPGIDDPKRTLENIRSMTVKLESSNPELATHTRNQIAITNEISGTFVNHLLCSFDSCVDRISHVFQTEMRLWGVLVALVVALSLQLDTLHLINQLSVDDQLRASLVRQATTRVEGGTAPNQGQAPSPGETNRDNVPVLKMEDLQKAIESRLVIPPSTNWPEEWRWNKLPGVLITAALLSLGAPFWFGALKNLLRLRPLLAINDDKDRQERRATQESPPSGAAPRPAPSVVFGEKGNLGDSGIAG